MLDKINLTLDWALEQVSGEDAYHANFCLTFAEHGVFRGVFMVKSVHFS